MISRPLEWLARHAAPLVAASVFVGLALPPLAHLLRPLLVAFILVPMTVALLRLDWGMLATYLRRPVMITVVAGWALLASPLLTWALLRALPLDGALETALVLMAAAPPIMAAGAFGLILGLDVALIVVTMVAATMATPFVLPSMALLLLGVDLDIGLVEFMGRLTLLVGGALLAAAVARRAAGPERIARNARRLDGLAVLGLAGFAVAIMDGVTEVLLARPAFVALCLAAAFAANLALQAAGAGLFAGLGRRQALSVGLMSGNRNMGLVVAVLADRADFDVVVFFALAQVPMYTLPALLLPLYRRLLAR